MKVHTRPNFWLRILRLFGWTPLIPETVERKSVICVAPHTSNVDFSLGLLYYLGIGRKPRFVMKKEWFVFPLSLVFKAFGGVAVDRSKRSSTVEMSIERMKNKEDFNIAITPEGTRSRQGQWHTGFYRIALGAGVPIELARIDYKRKEVGIFETFYPTGDMEKDILEIRSRYTAEMACHPKNFSTLD